jgi:hypothetical protein
MTVTEDRVRTVLANQAAAMRVPDGTSSDEFARVINLPTRPHRPRALMVTAAAGLLLAAGIAVAQRRTDQPATAAPAAAATFHFETPSVVFDAASVEVTVADKSFVPPADVLVEGDPEFDNNTTLELTWHDQGIEQRILMYFTSDGTNWWATEIRTYDGGINGDWITEQGEYFKSPLGSAFVGDVDLPNLKIRGMQLEAFRRPSSCDNPTSPLALIADYPHINSVAGGYGATLKLVDTTTCQPVAVSNFTFEYQSDNPAIARLFTPQLTIPDYPPTLTRVDLDLVSPGYTVIHVVAKDQAGTVVGSADMQITVRPGDAMITPDTGVDPPTVAPPDATNAATGALPVQSLP